VRIIKFFLFLFIILFPIHSLFSPVNANLFGAYIIPVNYGDSILLKLPQGETMLIDGGAEEYGRRKCPVLRTNQSGVIVIKTDGKTIWWETGGR
jgi:hypothetical protein